jgi:hypothetical protein
MGATEEQMQLLSDNHVTHVSYILILYSIAFLMYLFVNILLHIYAVATWPDDESNGVLAARGTPGPPAAGQRGLSIGHHRQMSGIMHSRKPSALTYSDVPPPMAMNGQTRMPRHRATDSQQVRDAEEFELEGLMSEDEEGAGASGSGASGETGLTSPLSEDAKPLGRSKIGSGV